MKDYIKYSPRASLSVIGICMQQMGIWKMIGKQLQIQQKTVTHTPLEKLQDVFINILAGGKGIVEVNQRVRTDQALSAAFGRQGCAEQSGISRTLTACTKENVEQLKKALQEIYQRYGAGYCHPYDKAYQLLDIDMSGLPAGIQGEGVEKGYFAKQKNKRGRQLGLVYGTSHGEIVSLKLYSGKTQLNRSLMELVDSAEAVLNLTPQLRERTILRIDGGGGNDADINELLSRHYAFLVKMTHWKRVTKLAATVTTWYTDPKDSRRQAGWVESPFSYEKPTRQLAVRCLGKNDTWHTAILVFNLNDVDLHWLNQQGKRSAPLPTTSIWAAVYAYDLRGGGVETAIKGLKQGLGITKRNKKSFVAQEMLLLLGQLAYNLITWIRNCLAACLAKIERFGVQRMVRDVFHISGEIAFNSDKHIIRIHLNQFHELADSFVLAFAPFLARDGTVVNLRKI